MTLSLEQNTHQKPLTMREKLEQLRSLAADKIHGMKSRATETLSHVVQPMRERMQTLWKGLDAGEESGLPVDRPQQSERNDNAHMQLLKILSEKYVVLVKQFGENSKQANFIRTLLLNGAQREFDRRDKRDKTDLSVTF